jgi:23S rRNA pseudouridine2605 synthase
MEKSRRGSDFRKKGKGTFTDRKTKKTSESEKKSFVPFEKGNTGNKERESITKEAPSYKNRGESDQGRRKEFRADTRKDGEKRPYRKQGPDEQLDGPDKRRQEKRTDVRRGGNEKSRNVSEKGRGEFSQKSRRTFTDSRAKEGGEERKERKAYKTPGGYREHKKQEMIRLNKYISNSGYCSRREADTLISTGAVTVDGKIITELGYKVHPQVVVKVDNQTIKQEKQQYVLLNKPKDVITTCDDPQGRLTVLSLIKGACKERLYPVGRLDRNTTGLLIMTNDGDFAKKIAHPSSKVKKLYEVTLEKRLKKEHFDEIAKGVWLDQDNFVEVDDLAFAEGSKSGTVLGIEIHSGKYHVVKRIFEKYGYTVTKLDRTKIDILTKKDLPRGRWRFLTDGEIQLLKRY